MAGESRASFWNIASIAIPATGNGSVIVPLLLKD
jgi:hypothetical protein